MKDILKEANGTEVSISARTNIKYQDAFTYFTKFSVKWLSLVNSKCNSEEMLEKRNKFVHIIEIV